MAANVNKLIDHDDFDYNRTVEELACLDSLAKVSRYGFNLKNTQFIANNQPLTINPNKLKEIYQY